jgi:hypothetical protein
MQQKTPGMAGVCSVAALEHDIIAMIFVAAQHKNGKHFIGRGEAPWWAPKGQAQVDFCFRLVLWTWSYSYQIDHLVTDDFVVGDGTKEESLVSKQQQEKPKWQWQRGGRGYFFVDHSRHALVVIVVEQEPWQGGQSEGERRWQINSTSGGICVLVWKRHGYTIE